MGFLKRENAPLTDEAWKEIDDAARHVLTTNLTARRLVDVEGPKGWDYAGANLGRLQLSEEKPVEEVDYGVRRVLPLVELRARCELDIWELDNLSRGAKYVELDPLEEAARRAARFEDRALLLGLEEAGIQGLAETDAQEAISIRHEPDSFLDSLSKGILALRRASVGGPFALVLGEETFLFVASSPTGYPLLKRVSALLDGPVLESSLIEGGLLISRRGGDFVLTLGQDLSVGYETHDSRKVRLFITESFTFQMMEPRAVLRLGMG